MDYSVFFNLKPKITLVEKFRIFKSSGTFWYYRINSFLTYGISDSQDYYRVLNEIVN